MTALYRSGLQAEALGAYADLRRRLVDHLGVDPAGQTQELHTRILRADPELTLQPPRPPAVCRRPRTSRSNCPAAPGSSAVNRSWRCSTASSRRPTRGLRCGS